MNGRKDVEKGWGTDISATERPGVPMERPPKPIPGAEIPLERQAPRARVLVGASVKRLPPVFGTAQPPRGLSGLVKRAAYSLPDHYPQRWLLLLLSDRLDVVESLLLRHLGKVGVAAAIAGAVALFANRRQLVRLIA